MLGPWRTVLNLLWFYHNFISIRWILVSQSLADYAALEALLMIGRSLIARSVLRIVAEEVLLSLYELLMLFKYPLLAQCLPIIRMEGTLIHILRGLAEQAAVMDDVVLI